MTGATAGIGLSITHHLLSSPAQHLLILTGRNAKVLESLQSQYPDRVVTRAGDMGDLAFVRSILPQVQLDGRLDGLILNHGTLGSCERIADVQVDGEDGGWESTFRVNVSSCVELVCLFHLFSLFKSRRPVSTATFYLLAVGLTIVPYRSNQLYHSSVRHRDASSSRRLEQRPMRTRHGAPMGHPRPRSITWP